MPEPAANSRSTNSGLLGAAGVAGGTVVAAGLRSKKLSEIARQRHTMNTEEAVTKQERRKLPRQRKASREPKIDESNLSRQWSQKQLDENPYEFRKQIKARRLADKAAKASKLAKGVTRKMGVLGATAGMADAIGSARRIEEEGGSWEARFGKFVEELIGLPSGATQRPSTEAEKKARWST